MKTAIAFAVILLGAAGCTTISTTVGTSSFDRDTMEIVGPASATVEGSYGLCLDSGSMKEPSIALAAQKAAESVKADFLINIVAETRNTNEFIGLACHRVSTVSGTAVRYKKK